MMPPASAAPIAEGIASAGRDLGAGLAGIADRLERRKEEQKREVINAKSADALWKANADVQKATGMDEHTYTGLPRLERTALVKGAITHLTLQQANAKAQREQADYENQQRFPNFARILAESGQAPENVPAPFSNEEFDRRTAPPDFRTIMGAAAASGYRPREGTLDDLTRAISASGGQEADQFIEDPTTGFRFLRAGNTRLPSGVNPERGIEAPEGMTRDARGNLRNLPKTDLNKLDRAKLLTSKIRSLSGGLGAIKNKEAIAATVNELDQLMNGEDGTGSGAPAPAVVVDNPELKLAQEALSKGVSRDKVAAKYKQRTGKDLPP